MAIGFEVDLVGVLIAVNTAARAGTRRRVLGGEGFVAERFEVFLCDTRDDSCFFFEVVRSGDFLTLDSVPPLDSQKLLERGAKPLEVGADLHICDVLLPPVVFPEERKRMNE